MATRKVFVDTDAGWDDWIALILLCNSSEVDVVGVVVNGIGEAHIDPGVQNVVDLLAYIGKTGIPVYTGAKAPLSYSNVFPHPFRVSVDQFYGYSIPASGLLPSPVDYTEALKQAVSQYPVDLEVVSIGGLTGMRQFMDSGSATPPPKLFVMGGAVEVGGNIADLFADAYFYNKTGEWNLFVDPRAADEVARASASGFYQRTQIQFVPLDASYQVPLIQAVVDQYAGLTNNTGKFVYHVLNLKLQESIEGGYGEFFYDPLAVAAMLDPAGIVTDLKNGYFTVTAEYSDEMNNNLGQLNFSANASATDSYVSGVNSQAYYDLMFQAVLNSA